MTKSPATSANVPQLISFASFSGLLCALIETTAVIARAARQVGRPRSLFKAEAVNKHSDHQGQPAKNHLPLPVSGSGFDFLFNRCAEVLARKTSRMTA